MEVLQPSAESTPINWTSEDEMLRLRNRKRKLEEAEPYNTAKARRRARVLGMEEAKRSKLPKNPKL